MGGWGKGEGKWTWKMILGLGGVRYELIVTYPYSIPNITPLRPRHIEAIRRPHDLVLRGGIQHPSCCGDEHLADLLVRPFCFDVPDSCRVYNTKTYTLAHISSLYHNTAVVVFSLPTPLQLTANQSSRPLIHAPTLKLGIRDTATVPPLRARRTIFVEKRPDGLVQVVAYHAADGHFARAEPGLHGAVVVPVPGGVFVAGGGDGGVIDDGVGERGVERLEIGLSRGKSGSDGEGASGKKADAVEKCEEEHGETIAPAENN